MPGSTGRGAPASERAAYLLGSAQALLTSLHSEMAPKDRLEYDATQAGIRASLDPPAQRSAWSAGEGMGLKEAVAYALGEV